MTPTYNLGDKRQCYFPEQDQEYERLERNLVKAVGRWVLKVGHTR